MPKQGKYAARLRKLGFEPAPPEVEAYIQRRIERRMEQAGIPMHTLTRKERRLAKKTLNEPTFIFFDGDNPSVHATDDIGKTWIKCGPGEAERKKLLEYGFEDVTLKTAINSLTMSPLPPEKIH